MLFTSLPNGLLFNTKWADDGFGNLIWVKPDVEVWVELFFFGE